MKLLIGLFISLLTVSMNAFSDDCVILLHGLARTENSMDKIEKALNLQGYSTVNVRYPSRRLTIKEISDEYIPKALQKCGTHRKVNFVTHSMGGIIIRQYLNDSRIEKLNHVVMLGPPNKGSEVVDKLNEVPGFKTINGPAGLQLGTGELSVPNKLGEVDFSLGVIAGTKSVNVILSLMLPKPNDGKVSVESTKIEGMTDHIQMPVSHTFMMKDKEVIQQIIYFLENGNFKDIAIRKSSN